MNNLSSYYGLTDSRMSASETDLPVLILILKYYFLVFRFVPEWLFINPWFHTGLFLVHALLLLAAAKYFWHLLKEYAKLNAISQKPAVAIQLFLLPLFLSNFIGIVAARSLHYQVPVFLLHI